MLAAVSLNASGLSRRRITHTSTSICAMLVRSHCLVGMEASNGAHYWARVLTELGHKVRLISPQFVTPYVKSNKNDRNDAEAICEAVGRPTMRFVPPKSPEQLGLAPIVFRNNLLGFKLTGCWDCPGPLDAAAADLAQIPKLEFEGDFLDGRGDGEWNEWSCSAPHEGYWCGLASYLALRTESCRCGQDFRDA